mmetsp:Transcript_5520/g.12023  ORF Transcript_5520/g.12023 Transcript_5520/m.12023 type:complete len:294 (-) Transcript_5520:293-1174(-)|eukprot:6213466-Pleurochrysis_carterae.AAC.1
MQISALLDVYTTRLIENAAHILKSKGIIDELACPMQIALASFDTKGSLQSVIDGVMESCAAIGPSLNGRLFSWTIQKNELCLQVACRMLTELMNAVACKLPDISPCEGPFMIKIGRVSSTMAAQRQLLLSAVQGTFPLGAAAMFSIDTLSASSPDRTLSASLSGCKSAAAAELEACRSSRGSDCTSEETESFCQSDRLEGQDTDEYCEWRGGRTVGPARAFDFMDMLTALSWQQSEQKAELRDTHSEMPRPPPLRRQNAIASVPLHFLQGAIKKTSPRMRRCSARGSGRLSKD